MVETNSFEFYVSLSIQHIDPQIFLVGHKFCITETCDFGLFGVLGDPQNQHLGFEMRPWPALWLRLSIFPARPKCILKTIKSVNQFEHDCIDF